MSAMFNGCERLTSLDLSNFYISDNTDTTCMFYRCNQLQIIRLVNCNQKTIEKIKLALKEARIENQVKLIY